MFKHLVLDITGTAMLCNGKYKSFSCKHTLTLDLKKMGFTAYDNYPGPIFWCRCNPLIFWL